MLIQEGLQFPDVSFQYCRVAKPAREFAPVTSLSTSRVANRGTDPFPPPSRRVQVRIRIGASGGFAPAHPNRLSRLHEVASSGVSPWIFFPSQLGCLIQEGL